MDSPSAIAKLLTAIVMVAERKGVTHLKIVPAGTGAVVYHWCGAGWQEELATETAPLHMHLMRHLATQLSAEIPPPGNTRIGQFSLQWPDGRAIHVLGAIDHDFEVAAYLELVDGETFASGRAPRSPQAPS